MSHKNLKFLKAVIDDGRVVLTFYRSPSRINEEKDGVNPLRSIRVFRSRTDDFTVGPDHGEFFDDLAIENAELIHDGPLEPVSGAKYRFVDSGVGIGGVYAYWVAAAEGPATGPVSVKVRDWNAWWPYEKVVAAMRTLRDEFGPLASMDTIGRTVRGRDLFALRVGAGTPTVGLVGVIHAGESGPELMLPVIRRVLTERPELFEKIGLAVIPVVNVDEREMMTLGSPGYRRVNANGVDLNRNFPAGWEEISYGYGLDSSDPDSVTYRGPRPASEPETQAVMAFYEKHPVSSLFSFHCLASICGARFLPSKDVKVDTPFADRCVELAQRYAKGMFPELDVAEHNVIHIDPAGKRGTTGGSLPTWCLAKGVPAFDLEILGEYETEALRKCKEDHTDEALLDEYRGRHFNGLVSVLGNPSQ